MQRPQKQNEAETAEEQGGSFEHLEIIPFGRTGSKPNKKAQSAKGGLGIFVRVILVFPSI